MKTLSHPATVAVLLGALLTGAAHALAPMPPVQHAGAVEYLSGGIGKDEATAIELVTKQWPLTLEFAVKDRKRADFAADVDVLVRDARQHTVLQTTAQGPFLLARLHPGHYTVQAKFKDKTLHKQVTVRPNQPARAVFLWPAETENHRS